MRTLISKLRDEPEANHKSQTHEKMKNEYKTLSSISRKNGAPETIANLKGLKRISFQITPRLYKIWMVLPSRGGNDCKCRLLWQMPKNQLTGHKFGVLKDARKRILNEYKDQIEQVVI